MVLAWHVVQSKPSQETRANVELARQGFSVFLPIETEEVWHNRQLVRKTTRPLFRRYVFVNFDADMPGWGAIRNTRGVARLLCSCAGDHPRENCRPAAIRDAIIQAIRHREERPEGPPTTGLKAGDKFQILGGPFQGFPGIYLAEDRGDVACLVEIFGRATPVELPMEYVSGEMWAA